MSDLDYQKLKQDTLLAHAGRKPHKNDGVVNPPVYHASTILSKTLAELDNHYNKKVSYGRRGTATTYALEEAVAALENAYGAILCPSGLAAITTTILACSKAGDHILVSDNSYGPCRQFMDQMISRFNVAVEYFDPATGGEIIRKFRPNTSLIWTESPGSQTFEFSDIPAIVKAAKSHDILVAIDNTWSGGFFYKPLSDGVDISVQAGTKYIVGHSDCMMGTIACTEKTFKRIRKDWDNLGMAVGPDDAYLAQRGLRTMGVRMRHHHQSGIRMAKWLQTRPEILRVMHPALPEDAGHEIWKRDFTGASGLFGFVMKPVERARLGQMLDGLKFFGMGYSWGGFESLLIPCDPACNRTATVWNPGGQTMRIHVGLEDPEDLIADLEAGFNRLKA